MNLVSGYVVQAMAEMGVTIITVCHNSMEVLPKMLASVPISVPVVIVDNASQDGAALAELAAGRGSHLIRNDENRGFGVACNQGAAAAKTEFLLFLNPDAELLPEALGELVAAMTRYPQASAMNPRIADGNGHPYFKHRSVIMPKSERMPRGWPDTDREVTVLSGAALFVRRAGFEAVGGFDENIFLYHEDDDLSRRLRAECGPIMFIRQAEVRHLEGHSSVRSPASAAFKARHMGRSRVYAMRKHGRPLPLVRSVISALLQLANPLLLLSARSRAKRWAFLRGVLSARRS
ncbi:MAG: glycosyltransferase family 2 protein [Albidovulum sp.]